MLVEFLIEGPPVSQQARRRQRVKDYMEEVRACARLAYAGREPHLGMARVEITFFYEPAAGDVDNIAKPILDGLKGVILGDDGQVMDIVVSKRPLTAFRFVDLAPESARLCSRRAGSSSASASSRSRSKVPSHDHVRRCSTCTAPPSSRSPPATAGKATRSWSNPGIRAA